MCADPQESVPGLHDGVHTVGGKTVLHREIRLHVALRRLIRIEAQAAKRTDHEERRHPERFCSPSAADETSGYRNHRCMCAVVRA